ncbi:MAG: protein-glutamate O-methyltransferase CheR [Lachnospiraceae bacterium]|nr:protein-glutamate O-methyltransferase CheR [Lachnospiraceae bacterium]
MRFSFNYERGKNLDKFSSKDYEEFKKSVEQYVGIDLNFYKEQQMKRRIESMVKKFKCTSYSDFFNLISSNLKVRDEFCSYLTINVTEFYRNPSQWKIFDERIVPYLLKNFGKELNIWSAACATGEEPYTIAMILSKYVPNQIIHIYATDIDQSVLDKAKEGVYDESAVKSLPPNLVSSFFAKTPDRKYRVVDSIKKCVKFEKHDLLKDPYPEKMNLIVCRNVMIYMTAEGKEILYNGFNKALVNNGMFFIGSTENILRPSKYGLSNETLFFYRKVKDI